MPESSDADLRPPLRIGLTGGIASGKSTISRMFESLGVAIIDTDIIARDVVAPGEPALDEIREAFGDDVFEDDGGLDRTALRRLVFADDRARARLEDILHPRIGAATVAAAEAAAKSDYQIIVVPLLVGSPLAAFCDRILVVDCDEDTQIRRLLARDAESEQQARRILAAQASREERLAIADDVIRNDGDLDGALSQVRALHSRYLSLARKHRRPRQSRADRNLSESR